jgi:exodeoxyribonuclease-3
MKISTWNVNGLQARLPEFFDYIVSSDADIYALQETKVNEPIRDLEGLGYDIAWNIGSRPGYSGTAVLFKDKPLSIKYDLGDPMLDAEGRLITLEYPYYYFINVYVPNSQGNLKRWYYRLRWDSAFREYVDILLLNKDVIVCGDLNVAHNYSEI